MCKFISDKLPHADTRTIKKQNDVKNFCFFVTFLFVVFCFVLEGSTLKGVKCIKARTKDEQKEYNNDKNINLSDLVKYNSNDNDFNYESDSKSIRTYEYYMDSRYLLSGLINGIADNLAEDAYLYTSNVFKKFFTKVKMLLNKYAYKNKGYEWGNAFWDSVKKSMLRDKGLAFGKIEQQLLIIWLNVVKEKMYGEKKNLIETVALPSFYHPDYDTEKFLSECLLSYLDKVSKFPLLKHSPWVAENLRETLKKNDHFKWVEKSNLTKIFS